MCENEFLTNAAARCFFKWSSRLFGVYDLSQHDSNVEKSGSEMDVSGDESSQVCRKPINDFRPILFGFLKDFGRDEVHKGRNAQKTLPKITKSVSFDSEFAFSQGFSEEDDVDNDEDFIPKQVWMIFKVWSFETAHPTV